VVRCVEEITGQGHPDFRDALVLISRQKTDLAELLTELETPDDADDGLAIADNVLIVGDEPAELSAVEQRALDLG
jgi:hypothetical protein